MSATSIVRLQDWIPWVQPPLADVRLEVELPRPGLRLIRIPDDPPRLSDADWAVLEVATRALRLPGRRAEADVLARVVARLPWHRSKQRLLRRLESVAFGVALTGLASEGRAARC